MPEPVARGVERRPGRGPAQPDPRAARARCKRARGGRLHGGALRRLRALPPAAQGEHVSPLVRPVCPFDCRNLRFDSAHPPPGQDGSPAFGGRAAMILAGVSIPVLALAVYLVVGNPGAIDPQAAHGVTLRQVEGMVERLAIRLKDHPDDVEGWKLLGRSYNVLGRFQEAAQAYAKAAARAPRDAQLLADFADALGMAQGQRLAGDPEKLITRALEIDPGNLKALAFAGTAAFERKDFKAAAAYWERMLPLVAADSEDARAIRSNVQEARSLAGGTKALQGTISLSSKLRQKASPGDAVFIFARAAEGPPMPLAVLRRQVRDLPVAFSLDDSMAMAPGLKLSGFPRVVVGARISRSGSATPQPGDLHGTSAPVANDATGVAVVIDSVR